MWHPLFRGVGHRHKRASVFEYFVGLIQIRTPAFFLLAMLLGLAVLSAGSALFVSVSRPWLGLVLTPGDDGSVVIIGVQRGDYSPSLQAGGRLDAVGSESTGSITVNAIDIVEEPDTLSSYQAVNTFRDRQAQLSALQRQNKVWLDVVSATGEMRRIQIYPYAGRPAWSLPFEFWLQLLVGCGGMTLGGWVWALRRHEPGPLFLAASGVGLMAAALSAAVYSTRELSLPKDLLVVLSGVNHIGTVSFGTAIICLLSVYPKRIASDAQLFAIWVVTALASGVSIMQLAPSQAVGSYALIVLHFLAIGALIAVQLFLARRNPVARAALGWFGLSILAGTSVFVFAIATPLLFGLEPQVSQASAFAVILLIYAGLALGVVRYRLFDLGTWAFRLGSYLIGAILLVGLDAFLIYGVAVERLPAFGLALLAVGMVYLPIRNALGARLSYRGSVSGQSFQQIVDIALDREPERQKTQWQKLLADTFNPLTIEDTDLVARAELTEEGQALIVPGHMNLPSLKLQYANAGRRLFGPYDVDRAQTLVELVTHAMNSSDAQEQGVRKERTRIARDLHDNIGAQLLRTLHTTDVQRKNAIVSETLADLRDIISNAQGKGLALDEVLAELRYETNERLALAGLQLHWGYSGATDLGVSARLAHTLRSVVRECASNTIRHAQARRLSIEVIENAGEIELHVSDDGNGFDATDPKPGRGLNNIYSRILGEGGTLTITGTQGTRILARFPWADGESA
ncbi:MAG: histidine kinase [Alphaproteobacteria bacterium]|nr:histidine kinase [Alphaproteobacteria bacterium]